MAKDRFLVGRCDLSRTLGAVASSHVCFEIRVWQRLLQRLAHCCDRLALGHNADCGLLPYHRRQKADNGYFQVFG